MQLKTKPKNFVLFDDKPQHTYIAQSQLIDANGNNLLKNVTFTAAQKIIHAQRR